MKKQTKIWLIIASFLIIAGCIVFTLAVNMTGWDFQNLSTVKYETIEYEISEDYNVIIIDADISDVLILPSENEKTTVICHEEENMKYKISAENEVLTVMLSDNRKWYEHIGVNFSSPKVTVYIPEKSEASISVKTSTGDITAENLSVHTLGLGATTGTVTVSDVTLKNSLSITVSTGKTKLNNINCKTMSSAGDTGDIFLNNVVAEEMIEILRSTGDVNFSSSDAAEIFIKTDTGDVEGSFLTDKIFTVSTDTGKIDIPKTQSGGNCEIDTDTGDIKIEAKNP